MYIAQSPSGKASDSDSDIHRFESYLGSHNFWKSDNMTNKEYAEMLLPNVEHDAEYYENLYKPRNLDEKCVVTRFAPSPTGFVHMGSLLAAFIASKAAHDTNGVFYLRIEDTDQKREVENGIEGIVADLQNFDISFDEGALSREKEFGNYGPYIQSKRKDIYQAFARKLIEEDKAYPCFCSTEELNEIRSKQEETKRRIGYYGMSAKCRRLNREDVIEKVKNGEPYIIRLKSSGNFDRKIKIKDLVKGDIEFPENDIDVIIIKSDGLPTYHFAHAVDDHLMHTTHVIRGDEWVSSLPVHIDLFKTLGFKAPKYAHLSPLMKEEDGNKRKLSKRKDPEAAVSYYFSKGIPVEAVKLYLMTIANTNFEDWYNCNKDKGLDDFKFEFNKISKSGSLFDMDKLLNISKNYISTLKAEEVYKGALEYAKNFDDELYHLLSENKEYTIQILSIERYQKKPRKDFSMYSDIKSAIWYMYPNLFDGSTYDRKLTDEELKIVEDYFSNIYGIEDTKEEWYSKIKDLASKYGYAKEVKEYKENPQNFKGHVGDICEIIRYTVTSLTMTPDLYEILKLLGIKEIERRISLLK